MKTQTSKFRSETGVSVVEILIVFGVIAVLSAIAIPQIIAARRLMRSVAFAREIGAQLRNTRQLAMSNRKAYTFVYDDATEEIRIINNNAKGTVPLVDPSYPNNAGSSVLVTIPLAVGGMAASEMSYGIPSGLPTGALGDGVTKTNLASNLLTVTFQPDGTVIDSTGTAADKAIFIYNNVAPRGTASAISVLGASGRVKVWRYDQNANQYLE
jgi:Tfp pilus assembly protein FimT